MKRFNILIGVSGALIAFFWASSQVMAASEFETSYQTTYQVSKAGVTTVRHQVSLKNKVSNIYAEKFSMAVGFTDLKNIRVVDAKGKIQPEVETTDNQTVIRFEFLNKVVGKDKVNEFFIQYQTEDIANRNGAVWEVNIPKLETEKNVVSNKVSLIVPSDFGKPAYISPRPVEESNRAPAANVSNTYQFEGTVLNREAISAVFGRVQFMEMDLEYHLKNDNQSVTQTEIALPPDTAYQKMMYKSISPKPINVREDVDGNWMAVYRLKPQEQIDIQVKAVARINFFPEATPISQEKKSLYTKGVGVWQAEISQINNLSQKLASAEAIYDYVVDYLNYDFEKIEQYTGRESLQQVLQSQLAICTGYTDLFISLARSAGIPARELEGYALTDNDKLRPLSLKKDVLHAWAEYYDERRSSWIQIDPTWADTTGGVDYFNKLDLNHLVFVIHGKEANQPAPAGGYKLKGESGKDVQVEAIEPVAFEESQLDFAVNEKLINNQLVIEVINQSKTAYEGEVRVDSEPAGIIRSDFQVDGIPPWGKQKVKLEPQLPSRWSDIPVTIIFNYDGQEVKKDIELEPPLKNKVELAGGVLAVAAGIGAVVFGARRIFFRE